MKKSFVVIGTVVFLLVACEQQPPAPAEPKVEVEVGKTVVVATEPKVAGSQPAGKDAAKPKSIVKRSTAVVKAATAKTVDSIDRQIAKLKARISRLEAAKTSVQTGSPRPDNNLQSP